jgi:hypothetical protein
MPVSTRGAIGRQRDVGRSLHQREFGRRLHHATAEDDRVGADLACGGCEAGEVGGDEAADGFLNADFRVGEAALLQPAGDDGERVAVLLPDAHLRGDGERLTHRGFLEEGRDDQRLTLAGQDGERRPLAATPAHAGEVDHRRSRLDQDGADVVLRHQRLGTGQAAAAFVGTDRLGAGGDVTQLGQVGFGGAEDGRREQRRGGGRSEKRAARRGEGHRGTIRRLTRRSQSPSLKRESGRE